MPLLFQPLWPPFSPPPLTTPSNDRPPAATAPLPSPHCSPLMHRSLPPHLPPLRTPIATFVATLRPSIAAVVKPPSRPTVARPHTSIVTPVTSMGGVTIAHTHPAQAAIYTGHEAYFQGWCHHHQTFLPN